MKTNHTNRLSQESSPYLQQHAHNPVDWYAWSDEAFTRAKQENKPIFLSIGYSTCHWCHVMAHESFENEAIARILNEHFISIKVDREERPDVDDVYMEAVQALTGSGGWPLSVFITPDGRPFYGGTYFPPDDRYGRPGFNKVLLTIADAWKDRRAELVQSADQLKEALSKASPGGSGDLTDALLEGGFTTLQRIHDPELGGFGQAPKFPQPSLMSFLLRHWSRSGEVQALNMVTKTLDAMANGGIYDHLGGGFHRYATDARWLIPHFEKMLYDQAQISQVYLDAYVITDNPEYRRVVQETLDYVLRDLRDEGGAFYSAEDADSEGHEGTFYVWTPKEMGSILGPSAALFMDYYGVTKGGNFEKGTSILNVVRDVESLAQSAKRSPADCEILLQQGRQTLFRHRNQRIRPHRDEKIITAWNGLMISTMSQAGTILQQPLYTQAAEEAAQYVLTHLQQSGRLLRSTSGGRTSGVGFLQDYSFFIMGLLDLYESTAESRWLDEAVRLTDQMVTLFGDDTGGALFMAGRDQTELWMHNKPDYDGAIPSGNSVAAQVLLRLHRFTTNKAYADRAEQILKSSTALMQQSPTGATTLLAALDTLIGPTVEITIAGPRDSKEVQALTDVIHQYFLPKHILAYHASDDPDADITRIAPFTKQQTTINGKPTVYVCENYACRQPVHTVSELHEQLGKLARKRP